MKSTPILFSGPMVRAIRDGRKTQTRRIVKPQPSEGATVGWSAFSKAYGPDFVEVRRYAHQGGDHQSFIRCPYGQPGDQLWVKERVKLNANMAGIRVTYMADEEERQFNDEDLPEDLPVGQGLADDNRFRVSIHMPRWASRITLEVTSVRVERLQAISEADAIAEGVEASQSPDPTSQAQFAIWGYRTLWESINGPGSWDQNPWVWVVEFKRVEATLAGA